MHSSRASCCTVSVNEHGLRVVAVVVKLMVMLVAHGTYGTHGSRAGFTTHSHTVTRYVFMAFGLLATMS